MNKREELNTEIRRGNAESNRENQVLVTSIRWFPTYFLILLGALGMTLFSCTSSQANQEKPNATPPNVILIMADDMGFECLSSFGSLSYKTPNLDRLAANGIRATQCYSQPLCTPSRVKIMTGQRNYRNYEHFGYLNLNQTTFGHVMKNAGYETCIVGKWQLNGLAYPDLIPTHNQTDNPNRLGFDEYCLWQMNRHRREGERFANPKITQNGKDLTGLEDKYGPDIFADYLLDFIDRKADKPFFAYYPMVLVHDPFVPTPDSEAWKDPTRRYEKDTAYFRDMVHYTDKIVGRIVQKLEEKNLLENTILIFTGDNGTHPTITSQLPQGPWQGAKGQTIDAGNHVPLVMSWPAKIKKGITYDGLIEFSDFFATFQDLANVSESNALPHDGLSFLPLLSGKKQTERSHVFVHYDPMWGRFKEIRTKFARDKKYKLYQDGRFFDVPSDPLEKNAISEIEMTNSQKQVREQLQAVLDEAPEWKEANE